MNAPEAAVARVQKALDHHGRYMEIPNGQVSCHCGETGWLTKSEYRAHVAVAAADAAVAPIAAQTLRDAAEAWADDPDDVGDSEADARNWLRDRADRIEDDHA